MQLDRKAPIKNTLIATIFFLILYFICIKWLDRPLAYWIQQTFNSGSHLYTLGLWVQHALNPTHWLVVGIITAVVGIVLGKRKSEHAKSWLMFGGSLIVAFVACGILKLLVGRYRPDALFTLHQYGFHSLAIRDDSGSPSGHTTMAFAGLWALSLIWNKRWRSMLFIALATLVGLFRLVLNQHFLGDIVFAIYLGILSAYWVAWALSRCSHLSNCVEHKKIDG